MHLLKRKSSPCHFKAKHMNHPCFKGELHTISICIKERKKFPLSSSLKGNILSDVLWVTATLSLQWHRQKAFLHFNRKKLHQMIFYQKKRKNGHPTEFLNTGRQKGGWRHNMPIQTRHSASRQDAILSFSPVLHSATTSSSRGYFFFSFDSTLQRMQPRG